MFKVGGAGLVLACVLSSCTSSQSSHCANGTVCPSTLTCTPGGSCVNTVQLLECEDKADGEECSVGNGDSVCRDSACQVVRCGDGFVEREESCDDGNTVSGDGCRSDCKQVEWMSSVLVGGNADALSTAIEPGSIVGDGAGNIYVAESNAHRVLRVDESGVVTVFAGTGTPSFGGDGGFATAAQLNFPDGLALDGLGRLFIADGVNRRIRMVDQFGVIQTVAGSGGSSDFVGGQLATGASIGFPSGVAVDGLGRLYILSEGRGSVYRVDESGFIDLFAGAGPSGQIGDGGLAVDASLDNPSAIAVDRNGRVLIAEPFLDTVRKVDLGGRIHTFAGGGAGGLGGPAVDAAIDGPRGIAIDNNSGDVYIAGRRFVWRVDSEERIHPFAGTGSFSGPLGDDGPAIDALLGFDLMVAIAGVGDVYISELGEGRVRRVREGIIETTTGAASESVEGRLATSVSFENVSGLAVDSQGLVLFTDTNNHRLLRIEENGTLTVVAGTGTSGFSGDGGPSHLAQLTDPRGIAFDADGNLYVADNGNNRIRKIDASGRITTAVGNGGFNSSGDGGPALDAGLVAVDVLAFDSQGILYFNDGNERVRRVDTLGVISTVSEGFSSIRGLSIDTSDRLYIADDLRVRRITEGGFLETVYEVPQMLDLPPFAVLASSVAVDEFGGIYVSESPRSIGQPRIRRIAPEGVVSVVLGTGTVGRDGDGGPANQANIEGAGVIFLDGEGRLFVADRNEIETRIRRVDENGLVTTVAGMVDPEGLGERSVATAIDPVGIVATELGLLVAGGSSGTIQRLKSDLLEVVAGRYGQNTTIDPFARFRSKDFGTVGDMAYDAETGKIFFSETTNHRLYEISTKDAGAGISPEEPETWTIEILGGAAGEGFLDGQASNGRFRAPTGLFWDSAERQLYVADTGNHVIRVVDVDAGTVSTVVGTPGVLGDQGDEGQANQALLQRPEAVTRCSNGDLYISDTGNHRLRRVSENVITTVLGSGGQGRVGEGTPSNQGLLDSPRGVVCDARGDIYVTSRQVIGHLRANADGEVDGSGLVQTIYGASPRESFPESVTRCLSGLTLVDQSTLNVTDSCTGLVIELSLSNI